MMMANMRDDMRFCKLHVSECLFWRVIFIRYVLVLVSMLWQMVVGTIDLMHASWLLRKFLSNFLVNEIHVLKLLCQLHSWLYAE